jgi:hypothetical protein
MKDLATVAKALSGVDWSRVGGSSSLTILIEATCAGRVAILLSSNGARNATTVNNDSYSSESLVCLA